MSRPFGPVRPVAAKYLRVSDVRGVVQLATRATVEVSHIVEGVHQSVLETIGLPAGKGPGVAGGVTGLVYRSVRSLAQWLGNGTDGLLSRLQERIEAEEPDSVPGSPQREALMAALNGVMGDRLASSGSPFAMPMGLRCHGKLLTAESLLSEKASGTISGKIVLMIHGLCMNDLQWRTRSNGVSVDHGQAIAAELGYTPLYLRYNSGRHVSENGRELSLLLEQLQATWPVPLEEISIVAHSMGGLVARSAAQYATDASMNWRRQLKAIVFLGTPHHGAPLERGGNLIDVLLGATPFTAPFSRLGRLRSAGITDLRYGHVLDEDWFGQDRFQRRADSRRPLPLPDDVVCFAIAATTASRRSILADRVIGDGLVPVRSALGQHADLRRTLRFARSAQWIAFRTGHNALLSRPEVTQKIIDWLR